MKKMFLFLAVVMMAMSSCNREDEQNYTSQEGIYGTVVERYGNWMPVIGNAPDHGERPISIGVYVYEYTKLSDFDQAYYGAYPMDVMPKPLVASTISNADGSYEVALSPGKYSVFLLENGKLYATYSDEYGGLMPVTVDTNTRVQFDLVLDHACY